MDGAYSLTRELRPPELVEISLKITLYGGNNGIVPNSNKNNTALAMHFLTIYSIFPMYVYNVVVSKLVAFPMPPQPNSLARDGPVSQYVDKHSS